VALRAPGESDGGGIILDMSVYVPNQKEIAREERLLRDPVWQGERLVLSGLLRRLSDASNDNEFFDVHVALVGRLKARQNRLSELGVQIISLRARRRELAAMHPKPVADLRVVQRELDDAEWEAEVQRDLHWLLLDVGDALVWRCLRFDRGAITALGQGSRVAWLSDGTGWDAEISAVHDLWNDGVFALMNDATTCLRLGDLTCCFSDHVEIREVKAGKLVDESDPQQVRLREAITLINDSKATVGGTRQAIVRCVDPYQTYLQDLSLILDDAQRDGSAVSNVSRSQLIVATDLALGVDRPFGEAEARLAAGWPADDIVMRWGSSVRRMRDRHHSFVYFAPLALLPLDIDTKVNLLLGQLDFTVWLNVSSVARFLRGRGLLAQPFGPPESASWFMTAGKVYGNTLATVHIAPHMREVMALELVTPAYMAKLADTLLTSLQENPQLVDEQAMVVPGDESTVWLSG